MQTLYKIYVKFDYLFLDEILNGAIEISTQDPETFEFSIADGPAKVMVRSTEGEEYEATPLLVIDGK